MSDAPKSDVVGAVFMVLLLTAAVTGIFAFLGGGFGQYWLGGTILGLWGLVSLVIFTRGEKTSH